MVPVRRINNGNDQGGIPHPAVPPEMSVQYRGIDVLRVEHGKVAEPGLRCDEVHLTVQVEML